jgi:hypothetical protein
MIPPVLHFIWVGRGNPLPDLYALTLKAAVKNTSLKVILHTDAADTVVCDGVELRVRTFDFTYNDHTFNPEKDKMAHVVDIIRLGILYEEGGIYSDLDVIWLKNPWHLLHHSCFIGFENKAYKRLCNAVMGAEPRHPAIEQYKTWTIENFPPKKYWLLANPYKLWKDRSDVMMLEKKEFFPLKWTDSKQMMTLMLPTVAQSTALHFYNTTGMTLGGEFFELLFSYLRSI